MDEATGETGSRGSPEVWLEGACELLLETGVDSVRILPLAKRLGLSRTSFYWFFKDRDALLDALVDRWREKNTGSLVRQCEAYAETIVEAMLNVFDCWFERALFDPQYEFAIRSWALQSPQLLEKVAEADEIRLSALRSMFERYGFAAHNADVRARTTYLVQIGYISMQAREDPGVRLQRISDYVTIFTGQPPEQRDLDRFAARHARMLATPSSGETTSGPRSALRDRSARKA